MVADFCRGYSGRFRYAFEPQQGKSFALNTGVREARGDVLAFTDDDVTVEPTWLQNFTASLNDGEWAGAGGRTLLAQPFSPPLGSVTRIWTMLVSSRRYSTVVRSHPRLGIAPYGANMAYRKEMFEKYGLFARLPSRPGSEIRNEDTEFGRRLLAAGERLRYEPSAVVYHPIPQERVNKRYLLAWWFDYGRALIREKGRGPDVWGFPRHYLGIPKMIGISLLTRVLRWMWTLNPRRRFSNKCWTWIMAGQIVETYRVAREGKRRKGDPAKEAKIRRDART